MIRFLFLQRSPCFIGLLLWLCAFAVQAANATSLTGTLTDPQGRFIADAAIRLLRRADSTRRETKTDAQGGFSFTSLDGGEYRSTVESPGFAELNTPPAITLRAGFVAYAVNHLLKPEQWTAIREERPQPIA